MTRNLKAFGLALVAAMAFGAIVAQGASAVVEHSFRSSAASTVLTGASESYSTGSSKHVATLTDGFILECDATFESTNDGTPRDTVTVHPTYQSCAGGTTIDTNGCDYVLYTDTTQASGHSTSSEHAAVSLACEEGHQIVATTSGCTITYGDNHSGTPVNQSLHGVRYSNLSDHSGKNAGTLTSTVKTISYVVLGGSFCGLGGHQAGTYTGVTYNGTAIVTGYESSSISTGSATTGRTWSHGSQVDISISTPT
jgi:hypothetical protein